MQKLDDLFTWQSLMSLQGAAAAALLVPNVLAYLVGPAFQPYAKWVSLAIAMGLAYATAALASGKDWTKWLVAFFNGCLIFASAVGVNQAASVSAKAGALQALDVSGFFQSWL